MKLLFLGTWEIIIIVLAILLLFGGKKIPELMKGLGEISPEEFRHFIGPDIRLDQVMLQKSDQLEELLNFYMGDNTMDRQNFIIDNLIIEEDLAEEESPLS